MGKCGTKLIPGASFRYHRIQTFLLRLFRGEFFTSPHNQLHRSDSPRFLPPVETVARSLYASTTRPNSKIFLDDPQARSLLFSLRIRISHFVNAFAGYTFDTAIGRNWRIFIRRLERLKTQSQSVRSFEERKDRPATELQEDEDEEEEETEMGEGGGAELKDIFALVSYHNTVLDRILNSCFLGAGRESLPLSSLSSSSMS